MKKLILILTLAAAAVCQAANTDATGALLVRDTGVTLAPTIATVTYGNATITASVPAGARQVTFLFASDFTGTVLDAAFTGGVDGPLTLAAPGANKLGAISYTVTAGSFRLIDIR